MSLNGERHGLREDLFSPEKVCPNLNIMTFVTYQLVIGLEQYQGTKLGITPHG